MISPQRFVIEGFMRRTLVSLAVLLAAISAGAGLFWISARDGWFGVEHDTGTITGREIPADIIAARASAVTAAAPQGEAKQILFGDLHVHTTISVDAFQYALPLLGGKGIHPLADACDFARYCSALDFWATTDHAESITTSRWKKIKDTVRSCQGVSGSKDSPDLVSFIGFEWTQVGRTPDTHFGHKNVIFRDLDEDKVSPRAISTAGTDGGTAKRIAQRMTPMVAIGDFANRQTYFDYNRFLDSTAAEPACDADTPSDRLPLDCMERAARPSDLVRKLIDEQKLSPLIIPHGSSWGFYTPAGTTWTKALDPRERPERFPLIEVFSGHGNSEEYRSWKDVIISSDGKQSCPQPTEGYTPGCWRAGEIILQRCRAAGVVADECESRAASARQNYLDMYASGHLTVAGVQPEEWLDSGQCTDCFLPAFNYRPGTSVQAGLATSHFGEDKAKATRFQWGFIASSDNHRARPGTGYKQVDRRQNTDATGPINAMWRQALLPPEVHEDEIPQPRDFSSDEIAKLPGLQTVEAERQAAFLLAGGLAAVHAEGRSREAIWDGMSRRETYATSGQKILLWFNAVSKSGERVPMGGRMAASQSPVFEVRAVGAFRQKPGCPGFAQAGLDAGRIASLCSGECDNPSDVRSQITRIEVVKIRPQSAPGEDLAPLVQDRFIVHQCKPSADGSCTFSFSDPEYAKGRRDALYYVKAIQEPEPMINADPLKCEKDAAGKCVKVNMCWGDYRSGKSECTAPAEPRAWSSPVYIHYTTKG